MVPRAASESLLVVTDFGTAIPGNAAGFALLDDGTGYAAGRGALGYNYGW